VKLDFTAIRAGAGAAHKVAHNEARGTNTQRPMRRITQREHDMIEEMYAEYQKNIKRSESLRIQINKGVEAGEPPITLLIKAIECISLMTGDKMFRQLSEKIRKTCDTIKEVQR